MRAEFLLTVKLTPENREELIGAYATTYRELRQAVEGPIRAGTPVLLPTDMQVRWILHSHIVPS